MHFALMLLQKQPDPAEFARIMLVLFPLMVIIFLIVLAVVIVPSWFICKKAGFSPWLSMLCLVPTFGLLVLLYVLAFADWKVPPTSAPPLGYPYPPPPPQA